MVQNSLMTVSLDTAGLYSYTYFIIAKNLLQFKNKYIKEKTSFHLAVKLGMISEFLSIDIIFWKIQYNII